MIIYLANGPSGVSFFEGDIGTTFRLGMLDAEGWAGVAGLIIVPFGTIVPGHAPNPPFSLPGAPSKGTTEFK